ncbi:MULTISPECIES: DNA polymerase III subunit delta, partial [Aphanizomenon]|uniref:DNA polymerase III subunit delta n=1 Tax=Aphanizomenon TaxID=1175 RepID=UPI0005806329
MPTYLYFGENEFFLTRTMKQLKTHTLDQQWANFNYTEYPPESKETIPQALSDIMTPRVGSGGRLVHLPNSTLLGVCSKEILLQLESILPKIPSTNTLLITNTHKPDARNKSVKLLLEYAQVTEFPLIPQWQTQALIQQARTLADEVGVTLTTDAYKVLIDYTGNNTRLIFTELEKLKTYALGKTVNGDMVKELVSESATNSLQLANAIRLGNIAQALEFVERLINCNEPALKITATLTTTFRTWLIVKQMIITGCQDDNTIAQLADVRNPKRLY